MPLPKPKAGEKQDAFMARCMHEAYGADAPDDRTQEQAVAMCSQAWRDKDKKSMTREQQVAKIIARMKAKFGNLKDAADDLTPEDCSPPDDDETYAEYVDRCSDELLNEFDGTNLTTADAVELCETRADEEGLTDDQKEAYKDANGIVHKRTTVVKKTDGGMEFILSDATPDRFGDIVEVEGWKTANFKRNPVALFNHNSSFPVGTWSNVRSADKALRGDLVLAPRGISERIDEIRGLVDAGVLRAVSVGFKPLKKVSLPGKDGKAGDEFFGPFRYTESELVEVSLVSIPANPNALAVAKSLSISKETQALVFGEHANKKTRSVSSSARTRGEHAKNRGRAINGEHAKTRSLDRSNNMLLSQRVDDSEKFLVQLQDQLQDHLEKVDDQNVSDDDMNVTEDLNTKIKNALRNRDNLKQAEQRLAKNTDQRGKDLAVVTVVHDQRTGSGVRPFGMAATKKINALDYLVRQGIIAAFSHTRRINMDDARRLAGYGEDEATKAFADYAMKAASAPAMTTVTGWAAELVQTVYGEFLQLLAPSSVMPALAAKGLTLGFGAGGRVIIPTRSATPSLAGSFIGEGMPIPVRQGLFSAITMLPKKLGVITSWTRELDEHSVPAIEGVLRDSISQDTGVAIDSVLLDTNVATAVRPPGLRSGSAGLTPTTGGGFNALVGDIKQLAGALLTATAGHIRAGVFIMNPQQALSISLTQAPGVAAAFPFADEIAASRLRGYDVIVSGNVPLGTVIFLDAADFVLVGAETPRFEVSDQATLVFDDTAPPDLASGSPAVVGSPAKNMFQTDSLALRLIWPLNWNLRRAGMVSWVAGVTW